MDIREHPPVRPLTLEYLNEALKQQTQIQQNLENKLSGNSDSVENNLSNDYNEDDSTNFQPKSVILAPYGLSATLTGQSYQITDQQTEKILKEWREFYPLPFKESKDSLIQEDFPPVVEVITGI
jgi:mediator of RNA polymerase II transcription subunit 13